MQFSEDCEFNLHTLALKSCQKNHDKCAIIYDNGELITYVLYSEVKLMSDLIAENLSHFNAKNTIIGYLGTVNEVFISLFISILQESSAFFTLNTNWSPLDNFNYIQKIGIKWIFADEKLAEVYINKLGCHIEKYSSIFLLHGTLILLKVKCQFERKHNHKDKWKLAYAIQTSGSTGQPKIVYVPHRCITPNIIDLRHTFEVTENDVVCLSSPLTFDPSIVQIFLSLASGSTLLILSDLLRTDGYKFTQQICKHKVTILQATPSMIKRIYYPHLFSPSSRLRILAMGGEPCSGTETLKKWKELNNKIRFFNIYGITEVSSWATIYEITDEYLQNNNCPVPLGSPMSLTQIEVRDKQNQCIQHGEGELYIGGEDRICFIEEEDDEILKSKNVFRSSGDWVNLRLDGTIEYMHRIDDQVKRHGKKLNLSLIENTVAALKFVNSCYVLFDRDTQFLWLFVILVDKFSDLNTEMRREIFSHLQSKLPSQNIPNDIFAVSSLPITAHGKINTQVLLTKVKTGINLSLRKYLEEEWKTLLNVIQINDHDNFISSGGDSIQVIQLVENITFHTNRSLPLLTDKLLHSTFEDVVKYLEKDEENDSLKDHSKHLTNLVLPNPKENFPSKFITSSRGGRIENYPNRDLNFKFVWKYNLEKCIDASPLIITSDNNSTVFIGSHSHKICAINLTSGKEIWTAILGDRIESSACASLCGTKICVGCYDHFIYCLNANDGSVHWKFKTGDQVKSSPTTDPQTGVVYIGSHDHSVYSLNINNGSCNWQIQPGNGSIFASPCVSLKPHRLYVATLDGIFSSIDPITGDVVWRKTFQKPIFSSPASTENEIIVVDVNGNLKSFSHNGQVLWHISIPSPVFSSPCIINDLIILGSHSNNVHCIHVENGHVQWTIQSSCAIYSTPFCIQTCVDEINFAAFASTDGHLKLVSLKDGQQITSHKFSGEIFSSPVIWDDKIVVGCRDNFVYCCKM